MSSRSWRTPDRGPVAQTREKFLTREAVEPHQVRDPIMASWWRSREWNVPADRIELSYVRDPDLDTPLTRSAMPVLRHLRENVEGQPISVILTDPSGVVLARLTADHDLERHLDGVKLAPGFSYAEELVGTNGIGTALEGGQPAHVFGHEHYAENLEDLACAGVPIHHPITGKTIGAVDLTCWRKDADPLLVALVKTTADQITQALLTDSSAQELELLQEYLRACRRTNGIVLALNDDVVMMNDHARQVLDPGDQAVLLGQAGEALSAGRPGAVEVELPTGLTARMYCRPTRSALTGLRAAAAGGVVHVKLIEPSRRPAPDTAHAALMTLPGLVGSGALWLRGCQQVQEVYESGEWLVLEGEPGVGKLAVLRAVQEAVAAGRSGAQRVAVTRTLGSDAPANLAELLRSFPRTVALPPLRHHVEDLPDLIRFFMGRLSQHGRLTCSPEAMTLLARSTWPGNIEQLWQVIRQIVRHKRVGSIEPADLPPECWTVSRRLLSPLEALERDAIVQSLLDSGGNKAKAAESLGMSRATIYRKIHGYGIVIPAG